MGQKIDVRIRPEANTAAIQVKLTISFLPTADGKKPYKTTGSTVRAEVSALFWPAARVRKRHILPLLCTMSYTIRHRLVGMKLTGTPVRRDAKKTASFDPVREKERITHSAVKVGKVRPGRIKVKEDLSNLPTLTASQLKKGGWPGVMIQVNKATAVAVTNHRRTEAVILTADQYALLVQQASQPKASKPLMKASPVSKEIALARLRSAFDLRLAKLKDGASLDAVTRKGARRGKVKIGTSY